MRQVYRKIKLKSTCLITLIFLFTLIPAHLLSETTIKLVSHKANIRRNTDSLNTTPPSQILLTSSSSSTNKTEKPNNVSTHLSMVAESGITFISVFLFGCVIILSVYSWKKFADSSWGVPSTYQYSALSQYDNDRDEEIHDLEDHLDILIEDSSSSDNEEEPDAKDIFDINAPATLPMNTISGTTTTTISEQPVIVTKNGRLSNSSSLLDEDSGGDEEILH